MKKVSSWVFVFEATLIFNSVVCAAPPQYTLTEIGSLGGRNNVGYAINENGDVVGQASTDLSESPSYHAFFYDHTRNLTTDLGTLGGPNSLARAINDCSRIAGSSDIDINGRHAALLSSRTDLGTLGGPISDANSLNDAGDAVGIATDSAGQAHAVFFGRSGTITDLGIGFAAAINARGDIAANDPTGAFILSRASKTYLGTLGGTTQARGLNNLRQLVGDSQLGNGMPTHAFLYYQGKLADLGTLTPGYGSSSAAAINDLGEIVGRSDVLPAGASQGVQHAFLYTRRNMQDLNALIAPEDPLRPFVTLADAVGINCAGWIVANGYDSRGPFGPFPRAYLMTRDGLARKECASKADSDERP